MAAPDKGVGDLSQEADDSPVHCGTVCQVGDACGHGAPRAVIPGPGGDVSVRHTRLFALRVVGVHDKVVQVIQLLQPRSTIRTWADLVWAAPERFSSPSALLVMPQGC